MSIKLEDYNNNNIFFSEPVENTVIENSKYIKLIFSDSEIVMNGITIFFNINVLSTDKQFSRKIFNFNYSDNSNWIESIKVIEPTYDATEISRLTEIIKELKKIPQPEQRTPEWYVFRNGRLTASDLGAVMGYNPYEQYKNVVLKKCGLEMPFVTNKAIKHGVKYEEIVTMIYSFRNDLEVFEYLQAR